MHQTVCARAPLRLGLAGGGTDVSPYSDNFGGAVTNVTIGLYVYGECTLLQDGGVELESLDLGTRLRLDASAQLPLDGQLDLHKAVYNRIVRDFLDSRPLGIRMRTWSEAPAGSGLGSSSTLVVALLQGMNLLLELGLGEYEIAQLAFEVERVDIGLAGGRQDQYAATFGGFNFMEFLPAGRVIVNPLRISHETRLQLEAQTVICFTGLSRRSATIIDEQVANVTRGETRSIEAMHSLKQAAGAMKRALLRGDMNAIAEALDSGWRSKLNTAASVSNALIDKAMAAAMAAGAVAGKVSGAGGGGFIMFMAPLAARQRVIGALGALELRCESIRFVSEGAEAWRA